MPDCDILYKLGGSDAVDSEIHPALNVTDLYTALKDYSGAALSGSTVREILQAAAGLKVSRIVINDNLKSVLRSLSIPFGFRLQDGKRRYRSRADKGKGQFRNKMSVAKAGEASFAFTYIGDDQVKVDEAIDCDETNDSAGLGRLLGFPPCCCAAYRQYEPVARQKQGDLIPQVWAHSDKDRIFDPWLNVAVRYFGKALISFFPCSFHCAAAKQAAREALQLLKYCDPLWAQSFLQAQNANVIYSEYEGVHALYADLRNNEIHYEPSQVRSAAETAISRLIACSNRIILAETHRLIFKDDSTEIGIIESPDTYPCLFREQGSSILTST